MASSSSSRRRFLKTGLAGSAACLGLGHLSFLSSLPAVSAQEAEAAPNIVRFLPEIEPLVRLIEDTERSKLLERIGEKIRGGTSYREVLTALQLAGIRNVQPRPAVGFKFHSVLVVNAAHLASLSAPSSDRWLPILWALDYFKSAQAKDVQEGDWTMSPVKEFLVPSASAARNKFIKAMDRWDEYGADAAAASFARHSGANEVFEVLFRYGMRDFRSIGHKAIYVANSFRMLSAIGWQHGEPVVRSLAYALLNHDGGNPATSDAAPDRPWKRNLELVTKIRIDWRDGKIDAGATNELLQVLREGNDQDASKKIVDLLNRGVAPQSLWDAMFSAAGEQILRQAGIISLHASTTSNALHFFYSSSAVDETRRLAMLQCAAFLTLFRDAAKGRGAVGTARIDQLASGEKADGAAKASVESIFADGSRSRAEGIRNTLAYLDAGGDSKAVIDAARVLTFLKGNDAHDYKFSSAVLEDFYHVSPAFRNRCLAASLPLLRSAAEKDTGLATRARAALDS